MKRFLLATTAAVALAAPAQAADLPVKAPPAAVEAVYSWTGFYIGGNAGFARGRSDATSVSTCPAGGGCDYTLPANLAAFGAGASGRSTDSGFTGGVQAGYNWQSGRAVFGIETDFNAFKLKGGRSTTALVPAGIGQSFTSQESFSTDWLFTLRGRLGWTVIPTALLYATGGLAVTDLKVSNFFTDTAAPILSGASSNSQTKLGWTAGAGLEVALGQRWTAKAEYLFVDFDSVSTTLTTNLGASANPNQMSTAADLRAHIARGGLNFKLN